MLPQSLSEVRYRGDIELLAAIRADDLLQRALARTEILKRRSIIRLRLLAGAVRVSVGLMPNVARSFERLSALLGDDRPLEAYVFAAPDINAFVIDTGRSRIVGVSSTAVAQLGAEELEFVIGHELGHAVFGHLDVAAEFILQALEPTLDQAMTLRAWQRATEISADRAGLVACGSIDAAASALFKTVCGLALPGAAVRPADFAAQWDPLAAELRDAGVREQWQLSHPFPPLRMKALLALWEAPDQDVADHDTQRLLAYMDPRAVRDDRQHDPLLAGFIYWGGMYLARSEGGPSARQLEFLRRFAPAVGAAGAGAAAEDCLAQFRATKDSRRARLSARELHQITSHLIAFAAAGGRGASGPSPHLYRLGSELGLSERAIDLFIAKHSHKEYRQ
ncbi:M48 family metallopeptidase [Haliangium sp.]|uniref:M48 family metallopeptidase n=1 Tax=Haliangium sp. TaxID=2663208 RepID=UPI003D1101B4